MEISKNASRLIIFLFLAFNIVIFAIGFYNVCRLWVV